MANETQSAACPCTPGEILEHWQGHRRLTRKVIEAFPDAELFTFSVGGMRPFGVLVHEFLGMALPVANQVATGTWGDAETVKPTDKAGLLRLWDEHTEKINAIVPGIPVERFHLRFKIYERGSDGHGGDPVRGRQRDSPSRAGLCLSARAWCGAAVVLRPLVRVLPRSMAKHCANDGYSSQRLKMSEPLVPPKPKEFDRA